MASMYDGKRREPLQERPTSKPSVSPPSVPDQVFDEILQALAQEAADDALAGLDAARSAFDEATGEQIDKAISLLAAAEDTARAVYQREGNLLTPERARLLKNAMRSERLRPSGLRPEYPLGF